MTLVPQAITACLAARDSLRPALLTRRLVGSAVRRFADRPGPPDLRSAEAASPCSRHPCRCLEAFVIKARHNAADNSDMQSDIVDAEYRQDALAQAVRAEVARGARVESQTDRQAVVVYGRPVNHLLHFVVGVFTFGIWWVFGWLPLTLSGGEKRRVITVDRAARVSVEGFELDREQFAGLGRREWIALGGIAVVVLALIWAVGA